MKGSGGKWRGGGGGGDREVREAEGRGGEGRRGEVVGTVTISKSKSSSCENCSQMHIYITDVVETEVRNSSTQE